MLIAVEWCLLKEKRKDEGALEGDDWLLEDNRRIMVVDGFSNLETNDEFEECEPALSGGLSNAERSEPGGKFLDDRVQACLDPMFVKAALLEEMTFMKYIPLYEEVSLDQCRVMTGRPPITNMWVDIDLGTASSPDARSILAARDFKMKGEKDRWDLFAAMPP